MLCKHVKNNGVALCMKAWVVWLSTDLSTVLLTQAVDNSGVINSYAHDARHKPLLVNNEKQLLTGGRSYQQLSTCAVACG